jgi:hypothetical protein
MYFLYMSCLSIVNNAKVHFSSMYSTLLRIVLHIRQKIQKHRLMHCTKLGWFLTAYVCVRCKHLWVLDCNFKYLKYLTKLELFDCQIFQILPIFKLVKLETLNLTIFETWLIFEKLDYWYFHVERWIILYQNNLF